MSKNVIIAFMLLPLILSGALINQKTDKKFETIIIEDNAAPSVLIAASELQKILQKACGANLKIKKASEATGKGTNIYLGNASGLDFSNLKGDGFKIVNNAKGLFIGGRDHKGPPVVGFRNPWRLNESWNSRLGIGNFGETGTLYGVYYFLEKFCSIRFYMPGKLGTVIPEKKNIYVPECDLRREPDFSYRNAYLCYMPLSDTDTLWYRRAGFGGLSPVNINHSFNMFQKYRKSHPEYFALVDGKRDFGTKCASHGGGHLCLTNPEVIDRWVEEISGFFDKNPSQKFFGLVPMDGLVRICGCPNCQAEINKSALPSGKFSNHIWGFIRKVANRISKKYPDKVIGSIAYQTYMDPPDFKLPPNVAVMFCKNRSAYLDKKYHEQVTGLINRWQPKADRFYCWEYYLYSQIPWRNLPVFYPHTISKDLKFLKKKGFSGEFIEAESWNGNHTKRVMQLYGLHHLNLYVTGKLYWDAGLDIDKLLDEYCDLFYGPAAKPMKKFISYAEQIRNSEGGTNLKGRLDWPTTRGDVAKVYSPAHLKVLSSFLKEALKLTKPESDYRKRVELVSDEFNIGAKLFTLKPRTAKVSKVSQVTGDVWEKVPRYEFTAPGGEPSIPKTFIQFARTSDNLYLKFTVDEPRFNDKVVANYPKKSIWYDDYLAIVFHPEIRKKRLQIILNKAGASYSKNIKISTQVASGKTWWSVVVGIPFKQIGLDKNISNIKLPANFYHRRLVERVNRSLKCWSPTNDLSINSLKHGYLSF